MEQTTLIAAEFPYIFVVVVVALLVYGYATVTGKNWFKFGDRLEWGIFENSDKEKTEKSKKPRCGKLFGPYSSTCIRPKNHKGKHKQNV